MIYCFLKGGLGNMLFQIAATKSIAKIKGVETCFPNFSNHLEYANKRWHLQYNENAQSFQSPNDSNEYRTFLILNEVPQKTTNPVKVYNYPFHYTNFIPKENNFVIDGYFQSEKYFIDIKKELLNTFKPDSSTEAFINKKYGKLLSTKTVSLHIRRGDYVNLKNLYNILDKEYYKKSLDVIGDYDNCLVFSDDLLWCKNNLDFKNITFVENEKDYIEMFLMSKCDHNVVSNSSFSWWGAWMNQNPNAKIIGPDKWFEKGYSNLNEKDIIPDNWIRIKT